MDDRCDCGSVNLFSGFFDRDGLAVPDDSLPGWEWTTFCNDCGALWTGNSPRTAQTARTEGS